MIGILVVTHGHLSEALLEAAEMLIAQTALTRAVTFLPGQGVEDLDRSVRFALEDLAPSDGILALVDLPGGSPARVLGTLLVEGTRLELVTGVNLPMLVEALMLRATMTLSELAEYSVSCGRDGIVNAGNMLRLA